KDAPRGFRVPLVPFIPALGILVCLGMMVFLPFDTWIRLLVWMLLGLDIYTGFGVKKSIMNAGKKHFKDKTVISICGLALSALLLVMANLHHFGTEEGERDVVFYYVSLVIGIGHLIYFAYRYFQDRKIPKDLKE